MEEQVLKKGIEVLDSFCKILDKLEVNYERDDEKLYAMFIYKGEDFEERIFLKVTPQNETVSIHCFMPFNIVKEKKADIAMAICAVNDEIVCGKWEYDLEKHISFNVTQMYSGSLIGAEVFERMFLIMVQGIEEYDDKFLAINKGYLKPEDITKEL